MRKPFFKKSHKSWYLNHHGQLIRLGSEKEAAYRKYHELMASDAAIPSSGSVASLLNSYLAWCEKNRSPSTYQWYRHLLSSFAKSIGKRLQIGTLKPFHVTQWLDAQEWNVTTRSDAIRAIKRAFNWAVKQGRLNVSPLRNLERPAPKRREGFILREQFEKLVSAVSDQCFRDYLTFLFETGARPQEIKLIEAKHCDLASGRIILPASQAKGKKFPRVIYFTEPLLPMLTEACADHPSGPIFRNSDGQPWNASSVNCRMRRLREKLKKNNLVIDGLCATALRHGFATQALKNRVDPVTVSILMGHSDASQVARTYQHLAADAEFLAQALQRARGQDG